MSTTLSAMTAAELAEKESKLESFLSDVPHSRLHRAELAAITAELDARCEKWELSISDGGGIVFNDSEHIKIYTSNDIGDSVTIRDAAEFHALLGYILSKEVKP